MSLRDRKKLQTRHAIAQAALELFADRGYPATTMSAVAERANVSLRTVAVHFPTKPDLVLADEEALIEEIVEHVETREAGVSTLDAMHAFVEQFARDAIAALSDQPGEHADLRELRRQVIASNEELSTRASGLASRIEPALIAGLARDMGVAADSNGPRIVAAATSGVFAMLERLDFSSERDPLRLVVAALDESFRFLRAGAAGLSEA
jgi:AcrR family transcriptional regulator